MATVAWPLKSTEDTGLKRLPADLESGGRAVQLSLFSAERPFTSQEASPKTQHILNKPPAPPSPNPPSMEEKCLFHLWV